MFGNKFNYPYMFGNPTYMRIRDLHIHEKFRDRKQKMKYIWHSEIRIREVPWDLRWGRRSLRDN